jgi:hypothetical protein
MQKVNVKLENCYGIRKLDAEFDFSDTKAFAIYAPNGVMKTSFALTFKDLSEGADTVDRIYKERVTKRIIKDEANKELTPEQIFVVEPYNEGYKSSKISTLLVNKKLREAYEEIHKAIDDKKEALLKELKSVSGLKNGIEEALSVAFINDPKEFFRALNRLRAEVFEEKPSELGEIKYPLIFNDKVQSLLEEKDFRKNLKEYIEIYDRLISGSTFFQKGIFNHNNASDIAKSLKENGFFKAKHSVYITADGKKREVANEKELEQVIQQEKDGILENDALKKSFEEIDKKLVKNKELREFREYIEKNKFVLPELENLQRFEQKLWIAYLAKCSKAYEELINLYDTSKAAIEKIVEQAKKEKTEWLKVIDIFNERFFVPFVVKMSNQDDVILKSDAPSITFEFHDGGVERPAAVEESDLLKVLSNGEKRALYILNIIFEVQARKETGQETLFIIDDIADSFDYKNKYAIIEYLKDISTDALFNQIILSHNFDFYRTIAGRLALDRKHRLHTLKTKSAIKLVEEKYQNNPFNYWKQHFDNDEMLVASIPFLRNLAEYCGFQNHYDRLTSLLHIKTDTDAITVDDMQTIIRDVLRDRATITLPNPTRVVKQMIYDLANAIYAETNEVIELEKKIVLSIAIRLKAEEFLIRQINDAAFVSGITNNQTCKLIEEYERKFPAELEKIQLAERVNLMTPENIHLNSFMYEPIIDMSNEHLKQLYNQVSTLP